MFSCQALSPTPLTYLYCCHWCPCHLYGAVPVFADELKCQSFEGGCWSILTADLERWFRFRSIYCSCTERWFSIKNTFCSCTQDPNLVLSNSTGLPERACKSSIRELIQLWPLQAPALTPTSPILKIKSNNRNTREHECSINGGCWFIQRCFFKVVPFSWNFIFYNSFTCINWAVTYWREKPTNSIWITFIMV